jgi:hypothetical protein
MPESADFSLGQSNIAEETTSGLEEYLPLGR